MHVPHASGAPPLVDDTLIRAEEGLPKRPSSASSSGETVSSFERSDLGDISRQMADTSSTVPKREISSLVAADE